MHLPGRVFVIEKVVVGLFAVNVGEGLPAGTLPIYDHVPVPPGKVASCAAEIKTPQSALSVPAVGGAGLSVTLPFQSHFAPCYKDHCQQLL